MTNCNCDPSVCFDWRYDTWCVTTCCTTCCDTMTYVVSQQLLNNNNCGESIHRSNCFFIHIRISPKYEDATASLTNSTQSCRLRLSYSFLSCLQVTTTALEMDSLSTSCAEIDVRADWWSRNFPPWERDMARPCTAPWCPNRHRTDSGSWPSSPSRRTSLAEDEPKAASASGSHGRVSRGGRAQWAAGRWTRRPERRTSSTCTSGTSQLIMTTPGSNRTHAILISLMYIFVK